MYNNSQLYTEQLNSTILTELTLADVVCKTIYVWQRTCRNTINNKVDVEIGYNATRGNESLNRFEGSTQNKITKINIFIYSQVESW